MNQLANSMDKLGLPGNIKNVTTLYIKINRNGLGLHMSRIGFPQGDTLSCLHNAVYAFDINVNLTGPCQIIQYADICMYAV